MAGKAIKKINSRKVRTVFYKHDPTFGFWGIPNIEKEITFQVKPDAYIHCRHNSDGNRDKTFNGKARKKSILCFGGSHSWGVGVEQSKRYTEFLESITGRRVYNLGHCSLGLDQICLAVLKKTEQYNPSIIVVEQYPWALHRILNHYVNGYTKPYFFASADGSLKLNKVHFLARFKLCRNVIGSFYQYQKELMEYQYGIDLREAYDPWTDPIFLYWKVAHYNYLYKLADRILLVMQDFCRQKGIHLLFGLGAIMQQFGSRSRSDLVDYDLPRDRLREILEKNRIENVDMTAEMLGTHTSEEPVIFPDGHLNERGHYIFAAELAKKMDEKGWLAE